MLGDFDDARFTHGGVSVALLPQGREVLRADGRARRPDRGLPVRYTFGVYPAPAVPDRVPGRPLPGAGRRLGRAAEAARAASAGSTCTRTSRSTTATRCTGRGRAELEHQCAECHSTNLQQGLRAGRRTATRRPSPSSTSPARRATGPGSRHVGLGRERALARPARRPATRGSSCASASGAAAAGRWTWRAASRSRPGSPSRASRSRPAPAATPAAGCSREEYWPGHLLAQTHRPALLDEGLYYADGQIQDEVYEWGSFLQSRMYAAGVTCADCHDAHDQKLKVGRDEVCSSCHQPEKFATRKHHFHREGGKGASCVACHMPQPQTTWSSTRGTTTRCACRGRTCRCRSAQDARTPATAATASARRRWSASALRRWFPKGRGGTPHYGEALARRPRLRARRRAGRCSPSSATQAARHRARDGGLAAARARDRRVPAARSRRPPRTRIRWCGSPPPPSWARSRRRTG